MLFGLFGNPSWDTQSFRDGVTQLGANMRDDPDIGLKTQEGIANRNLGMQKLGIASSMLTDPAQAQPLATPTMQAPQMPQAPQAPAPQPAGWYGLPDVLQMGPSSYAGPGLFNANLFSGRGW